ncbi:TonB-dependent receptor [Cytophaga aurantiaca]|uniref:TonB-dependent receptor n=1 Tax=Cytophaga aurantiaca TaxID=29530 RepID=UPI00035F4DEB|nr:TonB-dependent receptor plug domain-containing protein [Cytophaga aurantiaca]
MYISKFLYTLFFLLFLTGLSYSQQATLKGYVITPENDTISGAYIVLNDSSIIASTNDKGYYTATIPCCKQITISVRSIGLSKTPTLVYAKADETRVLNIRAEEDSIHSRTIEIKDYAIQDNIVYNAVEINTISAKYVPSAFGDFSKVLPSMALGVSSNNELSTQYTVRGGNYDENLIYINDIQIYTPQLAKAGQQQGLSTVNPDLIKRVSFSSGGWEAKYGDKLSSVLNADYKTPNRYAGSITASLLGGAAHIEGINQNKRISFVSGARLKSASYLLNTLDTKGEYKPLFWDWQTLVTFDVTKASRYKSTPGISKVDVLFIVSKNKYQVIPTTRQTTFGTLDQLIQFDVAFDGRDILTYQTTQGGIRYSHKFSNRFKSTFGLNGYLANEREYYDIEAGYRISEVDADPTSPTYNQNAVTKGIGSYFDHGRNLFKAGSFILSESNTYHLNKNNAFEFGASFTREYIKDHYEEYNFTDSAAYVNLTRSVYQNTTLASSRIQGYLQHIHTIDSTHTFVTGLRLNYWSLNQQVLFSPRVQYTYQPRKNKSVKLRIGTGLYQQPAFFREMRALDGTINKDIKAQRSFHFITGIDKKFIRWGRTFTLITEAYVKYIDRIVPYDLYDVRIRYYGINDGTAYAAGMDMRLNGEFVKGVESWFNLGILTTKENISNDDRGYIRRPTDQRVTAAIFFQDHIPNNPTLKVYLSLMYGSGLPFGPPGNPEYRSALTAPAYERVDIGFSKLITFNDKEIVKKSLIESLWISLEVLNLFGNVNVISYLWVPDYSGNNYAIPNTLTARVVNLKTIVRF